MKPQMPFAPRGGCFVLEGDALVLQSIRPDGVVQISGKFTVTRQKAIEVPADGGESPPLAGDGSGVVLPEAEQPNSECGALKPESPTVDSPAPRRRRRK